MIYARINPDNSVSLVDLDPAFVAALIAAGNPKADSIRAYVIDAQPVPSAAQRVVDGGYVIEPTQVRKTWALAAKSAAELDAETDAAELEQLKTIAAALQAGTGTAGERLVRVERVCVWLLKQAAKQRGVF